MVAAAGGSSASELARIAVLPPARGAVDRSTGRGIVGGGVSSMSSVRRMRFAATHEALLVTVAGSRAGAAPTVGAHRLAGGSEGSEVIASVSALQCEVSDRSRLPLKAQQATDSLCAR